LMSMEQSNPGQQHPEQQKKSLSTKQKWMIGCGGCLGVILLLAVGLAALIGLGVNSASQTSNQAVAAIFGPSYKPENYVAFGWPFNTQGIQNAVLLIGKTKSAMIIGVQTSLPQEEMALLHSGKLQLIQPILKRMTDEAVEKQHQRHTSSSTLRSFRLDQIQNLSLTGNKTYTICNATAEIERRGIVSYAPTSIALLPEANNALVVLATFDPNNTSTNPQTDFSSLQKDMQDQLKKVIQDSELDERLSRSTLETSKK